MATKQDPSITNLLAALELANQTNGYDIWIPSLKRRVKFSEITTGQQKQLIRAVVDNPVYHTNFIIAIYEILMANCQDKTIDIGSLFVSDKLAIIIQLRIKSNGAVFNVDGVDVDLSSLDIESHFAHDAALFAESTVKVGPVTIQCVPPTIKTEYKLEKEMRAQIDNANIKSYEDIRNVVAEAYIGELAKHIKMVSISYDVHGDAKTWNSPASIFKELYTVVEALPASVARELAKYVESIQAHITKITTFKNVEGKEVELPIDAALFSVK